MSYNWNVEIPEPTGNIELDYAELHNWALQTNEKLKRVLNQIGAEYADILTRIGGAQG